MKLESQILARQYPLHQGPPASEDEDKPTFFFGVMARAQLVDPAASDGYFDDLPSSIEERSAEYDKSPNMMLKPADLSVQSEDRIISSKTTIFHTEQQQEKGRHLGCFERIKIATQGDSASGMQTMAEPEGSHLREVDQAV